MATWTPVLCSSGGVAQRQLAAALVTYRRELNRAASLKPQVAVDSKDAESYYAQLAGGLPQARLYQDGTQRFSGLWSPSTEESADVAGALNAEFRDPLDLLARRWTDVGVTFSTTDAGEIAWALISATDAAAYLTLGSIEPTKDRDRTYDRKVIADALIELTEVEDGFDFIIAPLEYDVHGALGRFDVVASRGVDRSASVIFEHGPETRGNASGLRRQTEYPVNRAIVVGNGVVGTAEDLASQAMYGVWETVVTQSDVVEQDTVDDKAASLLQPAPAEAVTVTPDPALAPRPILDYDVGDTITIRARQGFMVVDTTAVVTAIEVDIDLDGNEAAHRIEIGSQRPRRFADLFQGLDRRLQTLEAMA